mmetsp:Transcript_41148/g.80719  ORF Transcript_41148/g.80719 Transcript_41148/m.80719 type:complete len:673 (-) Transcript_41148:127-2145(-)
MVNVDTPTIEMSILLLSVCLVYALAYAFVKYFSAKDYSHPLSNAVVTFALTSSLMCILLIPADVMGSSNKQRFQMEERNLKTAYYGLYVCLVVTVFIIVPFAYFFVEDSDNEDEDGIQPDFKERCASASKSTFMVLLLVVVFVLVALLVGTSKGHHELSDQKHVVKWLTALMEGVDGGFWERLLMLCVGLLTTIGLANYVLYTSYGLFALPITLIRGSKKLEDEQDLVEMDRLQIRLKKMRLQQKYAKKGGKVSSAHARELAKLEKEEKLLKYQQAGLQALSEDWSYRCWRCIAPVRVMVGCCLIVFSSLVFVSLLLSTMDRQMNSLCGMRCGYVVDSPQIFNPLDRLLMLLAKFFPFDYVLLAVLALYFFLISLFGIVSIGVRCCGVRLFEIKKGGTWPQGLLLCAVLMVLVMLGVGAALHSLIPVYLTFGSQTFTHHLAPGQPLVCTLTDSVRHLPPRPFTPLAAPSFLEVASLEATVKTGKGWKEGSFPSSSVTQPSLRASPHVAAGLEPHLASPFAAGHSLHTLRKLRPHLTMMKLALPVSYSQHTSLQPTSEAPELAQKSTSRSPPSKPSISLPSSFSDVQSTTRKAGAPSDCVMTKISIFMNQLTISMPFFSAAFFFSNWVFLFAAFVCFLSSACGSKNSLIDNDAQIREASELYDLMQSKEAELL